MTVRVDWTQYAALVGAGFAAGLTGSIAGLASLFSYPALLAFGLPPVSANVTNTLAMFATTVGSASSSRLELRGQGRRLLFLTSLAGIGGAIGAAILLTTPDDVFESVVPFLIALGSVLLLARNPLRRAADRRAAKRPAARVSPAFVLAVISVGVYGGYFGAGAGIIMLSVLSLAAVEPLAVTNAVKNVVTGGANLVAAVAYVFVAPVHWVAAGTLAVGLVIGSWIGPAVVRRVPATPLRVAIALAGLGLAVHLWLGRA